MGIISWIIVFTSSAILFVMVMIIIASILEVYDSHKKYLNVRDKGFTNVKDLDEAVDNAVKGFYGNFPERKYILEKMGFDYYEVQNLVDRQIKGELE